MNTRKNNSFFRYVSLLILFVYSISIVVFAPPKAVAQIKTIRKSRLTIPVNRLAVLVVEKNNGVSSNKVLVTDYLSSTKAVVNEEGVTTGMPSYYPYGSIRDDVQDETDRLYTQQRKVTADSSVYNYNARYYNPTTGIFIQPDSVEGPARYTYVAGNPAMANDPSGNVISYNNIIKSDYSNNPTPCSENVASCIGAHLNYSTGILSAVAFLTPDGASNWLDKEVKEEKKYISKTTDLSSQIIAAAAIGGVNTTAFVPAAKSKSFLGGILESLRSQRAPMSKINPIAQAPRLARTVDSAISEAAQLYNRSGAIRTARQGLNSQRIRNPITAQADMQSFFQAMREEGVSPVVDVYGRYSQGYHTSPDNLIRTLDRGGNKLLLIHPDLNSRAINGFPDAIEEIYTHGVHDFAAVKLGFHSPGHPHQGMASGFHELDYHFQRSIGHDASAQYLRKMQTQSRERGGY